MTNLLNLFSIGPTAVVGTTGAGKTHVTKTVVEDMLEARRRVIVIDPTGAWYGLRSGIDGEAAGGFPVLIFGGDHGDIDITPDNGARIAEALAERDVQAIIDTSDMTGNQKTQFLIGFFETLYARNKAALHLIVDEADEVCPQNPMPDERRLSGAFDKIVRRGRIKGFRPVMITQRPAVLHKNVLSQIGTLVALKLTSPQDRKAIEDWVKGNANSDQAREVMQSLPTLALGEGWVWSPAADVLEKQSFPPIKTFDSSRTPQIGETILAPALTQVDVEALRTETCTLPDESQVKTKAAPMDESHPAVRKLVTDARAEGYQAGHKDGCVAGMRKAAQRVLEFAGTFTLETDKPIPTAPSAGPTDTKAASDTTKSRPAPTTAVHRVKKQPSNSDLSSNPLLLAAQSVWPVKLSWSVLAAMCGRKARGGHFNTTRKALIEGGYVSEVDGLVVLSVAPESGDCIPADLLEENLPQPASKMFAAIRQNPGMNIDRLATWLGMKPHGGHWNTGMSILRKNGLIDELNGGLSIKPELEGC